MKESMIVYIEGIPAGGKTTTLNRLSKKFPDRLSIVSEYVNSEEAQSDQSWFMRNDEMKLEMAKGSKKEFVFVDRGHLSTVIYSLAEARIKGDNDGLKVFDWYFGTILPRKQLPDYYIFLRTNPELSLKRRAHLLTKDNMWDYQEALELANNSYPAFMNKYEQTIPLLTIHTDQLTLDQLEEQFISHFKL